jgi:hypothetical protein
MGLCSSSILWCIEYSGYLLIGKDGKIIALNPRGKGTLEKELAKVL